MARLTLQGVHKSFSATPVVHPMDLVVNDGEFVVLVGPSGCGKSTLLRMIAGLETVSGGSILIGSRDATYLEPKDRNIGMVFQDYALYPHMSVRDNIGFGLKIRGLSAAEIEAEVLQAARTLEMEHLLDRRPAQLSGGQRQRVAMGRCLVRKADVFLFDEPLSNLDAKLRAAMRAEIKHFHKRTGVTTIYVTHDQVEAMTLADRIVCLDAGRISQQGTPNQLYMQPSNTFVAGFIGSPPMNFIQGRFDVRMASLELSNMQSLKLPPSVIARLRMGKIADNQAITLGLRPEHLQNDSPLAGDVVQLNIAAQLVENLGAEMLVHGNLAGHRLISRCKPVASAQASGQISLSIASSNVYIFDDRTGKSI
jgi:ABC-type sugar transport system ATPase subunit